VANAPKFEHLSQPIDLGSVRLRNRLMKNGTGFFWDDPETGNFINDKYIAYFEALAKGGLALASSAVSPLSPNAKRGFKIIGDEYIPGWTKWADAVKRNGCLAFHQFFHGGPMRALFSPVVKPGLAASAIPRDESPRPFFLPGEEITKAQIEDVVDVFAAAAERMKKAGMDGTELNGACNHLINCFLSRAWNRREDEYGPQNYENRTRLFAQIIQETKRRCGKDWPIIALINGMEPDLKDGITTEESAQIAQHLEKAGADAIEVRSEFYTWTDNVERRDSTHFPDIYFYPAMKPKADQMVYKKEWGRGANVLIAAEIKKAVTIPVIVCGKMDWENGDEAIARGQADIISMNRRLLADPMATNKALEGRMDDIVPCTSCMTCYDLAEHHKEAACRVNPSFGREREYEIHPAETKKKVMIIGGGPAGMEAARVATLRGHEVVIYDNQKRLGGSMPLAQTIKGLEREDIMVFVNYLRRQVDKLGIRVHTDTLATPETVRREKPDVLLLAAGGSHRIPAIPGIDSGKVKTGKALHARLKLAIRYLHPATIRKLSNLWLPGIGKNVVIMGGRLHGCQTAEFLVHFGRQVTIVDTGTKEEIGEGLLEVFLKPYLMYWLEDHGTEFVTEVQYKEVNSQGLVVIQKDGSERTLAADTVITAIPLEPNSQLEEQMRGTAPEVHVVGDSRKPALIFEAVADGARIAREI